MDRNQLTMDELRGDRLQKLQIYAAKTIMDSRGLPPSYILTRLEIEIPHPEFGFDNFLQFLSSLDTASLFRSHQELKDFWEAPRSVHEIAQRDGVKYNDEVYWAPNPQNLIPYRGKVKWIGNIGGVICAGIECEQITGFGPLIWNGKILFNVKPDHAKLAPIDDVFLTKNYEEKSFKGFISSVFNSLAETLGLDSEKKPESFRPMSAPATSVTRSPVGRMGSGSSNSSPAKNATRGLATPTIPSNDNDTYYPLRINALPNGLKISDLVVWVTDNGPYEGVLAWIGYLRHGLGLIAGVDFQRAIGNTDGKFHEYQLFQCGPNHGRFIRIEELVSMEDFYKVPPEEANLSTPDSEQDQSIKMDTTNCAGENFLIGDGVTYIPTPNEKWNGTVLWKNTEKRADGDVLYGIEFDKPTGISAGGEQALPFMCRSGYGGLAVGSKMVRRVRPGTSDAPHAGLEQLRLDESRKQETSSGSDALVERRTPEDVGTLSRLNSQLFHLNDSTLVEPCIDLSGLQKSIGFDKGIQGENNSCYIDATLFVLLTYTNIFDVALLQDNEFQEPAIRKFKHILRTEIANQLRRNNFCSAAKIKLLRDEINRMRDGIRYGNMADVEEFLYVLFESGLKMDNFIHYSNGVSDFLHQTIINTADSREKISTQRLLENSMFQDGNIKFNRIPFPAFFMVLPRSNGKLVKYKIVVPSLMIDLTHLLTDCKTTARPCILCSTNLATTDCKECFDQIANAGVKSSAFCAKCYALYHQEESRRGHSKTIKSITYSVNAVAGSKNPALQLLGIICFKGSHYVSYAKCGSGAAAQWIRHNSMQAFGSPEVKIVPGLNECLVELERDLSKIKEDWDLFIPEVKEILTDTHMCVYAPSLVE